MPARLHRFANPRRFTRLAHVVLRWSASMTVVLLALGLYLSLFVAPTDYRQSEAARIMFVPVPPAWMALFVSTAMAAASAVALIWKHPLADLVAKAAAPGSPDLAPGRRPITSLRDGGQGKRKELDGGPS